jgi:hypothetical protein
MRNVPVVSNREFVLPLSQNVAIKFAVVESTLVSIVAESKH